MVYNSKQRAQINHQWTHCTETAYLTNAIDFLVCWYLKSVSTLLMKWYKLPIPHTCHIPCLWVSYTIHCYHHNRPVTPPHSYTLRYGALTCLAPACPGPVTVYGPANLSCNLLGRMDAPLSAICYWSTPGAPSIVHLEPSTGTQH